MNDTHRARTGAHDLGLLLLRLVVGGFLLPHGLGKLFGWFGGPGLDGFAAELQGFGLPSAAPLPLLLAAVQTLAGLCVAIGLFARASALLAAGFLAATVALNLAHGWFWMHGGIEYPLMWTLAMAAIALLGPGAHAFDARRRAGGVA
ncbi:MAG: DoxX family protein [Lysobacteraceae bacterium]